MRIVPALSSVPLDRPAYRKAICRYLELNGKSWTLEELCKNLNCNPINMEQALGIGAIYRESPLLQQLINAETLFAQVVPSQHCVPTPPSDYRRIMRRYLADKADWTIMEVCEKLERNSVWVMKSLGMDTIIWSKPLLDQIPE